MRHYMNALFWLAASSGKTVDLAAPAALRSSALAQRRASRFASALISFFFALSLATSVHAQNLLSNPGFETGDFSSWSTNLDPVWDAVDSQSPHSGTYEAYFGNPQTSSIYQDFPTVAGATYTISFWYQAEFDPNNVSQPSELQVLFGSGSLTGTLGSCSGNCIWDSALLATSWTQVTLTVSATSSTSRIQFLATDQVAFIDLDDVSVVLSPPSVTSVSPASGPVPGGTSVTITGTGFTGASAVKFGAIDAASYSVDSATQITASTPASTGAGTVDVTVTTAVGTSAISAADQFTYVTANQTLTFGAAPTVKVNGTGTVTASSALPNSGNPITFSTTSTDCTVTSAGVVTGITAGTNNCSIVATQAGNGSYNTGTATQTFSIGKANQTITFGAQSPASQAFVPSGTFAINPLATSATPNSGNAVTYSSLTGGVCSVSGTTVTMLGAGTCTLAADQAGNGNYNNAAQVTQNVAIGVAPQTLTFGAAPTVNVNGTGTVSATSASPNSGNPITYSTSSTDCSVTSAGVVSGINAGTNNCAIVATQAGDANYAAGTATQTFSIGKASQTITFAAQSPASHAFVPSGTFAINPLATSSTPNSGSAVAYSSLTGSVCSVSGTMVTMLGAGTCTLAADQAGNGNYNNAAQVTQNVAIGVAPQTLTFGAAPTVRVSGTGTVTASSALPNSGNPITFSTTSTACTVTSAGVVTGITAGTNNCAIVATQAGNGSYTTGTATQTLSIGQDATTLTLVVSPNPVVVGHSVTLTATVTGDPPTGTVTFCDGATTINASCAGGTLLCASALTATTATSSTASCTTTFSSPGTHLLSAFYAGDGNYTATATEQALAETVASPAVPAPLLSSWLLGLLGSLLAAIGLARVTGNRSSQNE